MSKKCMPLWREAHFEVKMFKTLGVRTTFGGSDVEKMHAGVARSTFRSQNVQNTRGSDHFWRFRCRKSARRCGTKHIPSQNVQNTRGSDHFWRCRCGKSARRCGAKHISKPKCLKKKGVRTTFGGSDVASLHYTTLHYMILHYTTLHYTTLHYTTLHNTTTTTTQLHSTKLHYTTLHYTTFHYTSLHYTTLHSTTLQLQLPLQLPVVPHKAVAEVSKIGNL